MRQEIIGLSGLAGSGKNLFAKLFIEKYGKQYKIIETSLAYQLRKELDPIIKKNFGLDIWTQVPEEKTALRGFLIHWADIRRRQTNGLYFINKLNNALEKEKFDFCLVTDVRFKEYPYDELDWFLDNGSLIHISKYEIINGKKVFVKPPNEFEKRNDPIMKKNAEFRVVWPDARKVPYAVNLSFYIEKVWEKLRSENEGSK